MTICPCRRLCVAIAISCFLACNYSLVFAQGTKITSEYDPIADTDRDRPADREQWFMRGRTIPGQATAALRYRAHLQKMQMRTARMSALQSEGLAAFSQGFTAPAGWTPLGPAPLASDATGFGSQDYHWVSGRATAVAVDHADLTGNTVYIGGAYGGVWKSTNAGPLSLDPANVTWTPVIDNQATLAVGAIAVQPQLSNPDPAQSVILVGTGETNSSGDSYYGLGILRSTDAGATWNLITQDSTQTRSFAGMGFSRIAFSTTNPNLVVAAVASAPLGIYENLENPNTVNRGIYYSTDAGISWTYASVKDGSVTIDPGSATSVVFNSGAAKFFAAMRYHGIYSSSDGVNWVRLAVQPGAGLSVAACPAHTSASCPIYRGEISVVPGRNEMYVWYVDGNDTNQGVWKSTNGGTSWTKLTDTGITNCGDSLDSCGTSQGFYNLELAAVPNGATSTDLYAGTINLYKCTITSSSPTCGGTGSNKFLNLTHVYGCPPNFGSIAHVHPDQHGIDFMVVNSQAIMYFANDGGIYRALDGYTGLTTGTCGGSNLFDSLNQTLGSMTQFVSLSQHPTDPNIILGGTQDNGSPATASAQSNTSWLNVNNGDGGYNEINPNNPTEWFTANTYVSIQKCSVGIACHAQDFPIVVDKVTVGQDIGAFYTPYILDPQNSSELLVGTCQVWRGTTTGTGFVLLSPNFESGVGTCSGNEANLVRSLAAGGPKDANNFSNVIYAGTDGAGPLAPGGGHLWVSTNAAGGTGTWAERSGGINPSSFPISGVAIDTSDATGQTAYVTIMGFHVSHVWKTSNAGQSWTDFTANLPDSPANAVVVDAVSTPGTVYVATDVGVFSSSTASPSWTELGPAPDSGLAGYLPNVSVTALRMFNSGGIKRLRASTYGRGVWEFNLITTPDFQASFSNNPLTAFVGQTAVFNGTMTASNSYNNSVNLNCTDGTTPKPPTCLISPTSLTPTSGGVAFTVNVSGPAADYSFNLHAVGTDVNTVTHDFALTLHVVDFNLTAPSPSSVTANRPNSSGPVNFQVTAAGSFSAAVDLSCNGLPAGAACNFHPSSTVFPTAASPVSVTLTITTTTGTPSGTFPLTINGSTSGVNKTQNLGLTVTANADYTLVITNPSQSASAGSSVTFNGTLTAFNGYTSSVNLSCGAGAPPTCTPSPSSLTPTPGGAAFTVSASSNLAQNYNFNIMGQGTDPSAVAHSQLVTFSSTFDFSITNSSSAQTVKAGLSATYNLDAAPLGSNFPNSVTLSCTGLPARSTCSFNPAQVNSGSGDTPIILTIATNAPIPASAKLNGRPGLALYSLFLPSLLIFAGWKRDSLKGQISKNRKYLSFFLMLLVLPLIGLLLPACGGGGGGGGGGQPGTPPGSYTVTVTAKSGALTHTASAALTVQ